MFSPNSAEVFDLLTVLFFFFFFNFFFFYYFFLISWTESLSTRSVPLKDRRKLFFSSSLLVIKMRRTKRMGVDVARLIERRTGTPLTLLRFPGAARDFFFLPRSNCHWRLSYGGRTYPCAAACINICAHVKDHVVHVRVRWIMEILKKNTQHAPKVG